MLLLLSTDFFFRINFFKKKNQEYYQSVQIRYDGFLCLDLPGHPSAVGKVSDYRCLSDCRSRGREYDPGPVPYFL